MIPVGARVTPKRNPLVVPTQALVDAIEAEWIGKKLFNPSTMPLTALAYTAIDVATERRDTLIDVLLAYAETDQLCYRSEAPELAKRQIIRWDPVLKWAEMRFGCHMPVTEGVMPVELPDETRDVLHAYASVLDHFKLAGVSMLTQALGSVWLALALKEGELEPDRAFALSRLEEDFQAEQWGEDSVALARAKEIERDIFATARFLTLLD